MLPSEHTSLFLSPPCCPGWYHESELQAALYITLIRYIELVHGLYQAVTCAVMRDVHSLINVCWYYFEILGMYSPAINLCLLKRNDLSCGLCEKLHQLAGEDLYQHLFASHCSYQWCPHISGYIWYMWQYITVQRHTEGQLWYPFQTYPNIHKSLHVLKGRHITIPLVCLLPFTQYIWHNETRHIKYFHHNLEYHTLLNLEYIVHKHNGLFMNKGHHMPEEWLWSRLALQYVLLWFVRYSRYRSMGHINNRNW